ncbi:hypothetical protein SDC9_187274 [bioreactor metagenome]|uniref:Uncharacterized protein n=1 Tax=bioreactor metagenome TaxID=1076179 RepID=A0A645HL52_9ZZZZ
MPVDAPQVSRFGLRGLVGAFQGLASDAVGQTDLHVQHDALQFHRIQLVDQRGRRRGVGKQGLPQRYAHGGAVEVAPAQEGRPCASRLLGQLHVEQTEGVGPRLGQHLALCQGDQPVAQCPALAGPGLQTPLTFKGL